jgi:diacylglycerol kinase family enzyme
LESLHFTVNALAGASGVEFGFLPCDGNYDFFSAFPELPASKIMNIDNLLYGRTVDIDLVKINERYCVNVAYIGIDTNISRFFYHLFRLCRWFSFFHLNQQWFKRWFNFLLFMFDMQPNSIRIRINGYALLEDSYTAVMFANTQKYGTGTTCAPLAKIDDGLVDLLFIKKFPLQAVIKMFNIYWNGRILEDDYARNYIEYRHCMNIEVETPESMFIAMDNVIYLYDKQFSIQSIPAALRLLLPVDTDAMIDDRR